jgi:putative copper export protein
MKKQVLTAFVVLLSLSAVAQKYAKSNLMQLSHLEFNEYDWKAQKLQKKGEKLMIYGTIAGLAGIGIGSLNSDDPMSSDGSDFLHGLAATLFIGGSVAMLVGIPMFFVGIVRSTRINEARVIRNKQGRIELAPLNYYCRHTQTNYTGVSVRLSF